jgi:hypothetical protein
MEDRSSFPLRAFVSARLAAPLLLLCATPAWSFDDARYQAAPCETE